MASLIAAIEARRLMPEGAKPGDWDMTPDEAVWCDILLKILRSGSTEAITAVTSNLRVFYLFVQQNQGNAQRNFKK